jgi:hypothetical protein
MVELMPNYGSDCTCGGDWTAERQLEALFAHVLFAEIDIADVNRVAKRLAESEYFLPAEGTLAFRAREIEEGRVTESG